MSKEYQHIMIDVETLGMPPSGVIASIGAAFFDLDGNIGPTFSESICTALSEIDGFTTDKSVIDWWKNQSTVAQECSLMGSEKPETTLHHLVEFMAQFNNLDHLKVWAKSPRFDLVMIDHHLQHFGLTMPWKFYNERDVRGKVDEIKLIQPDYQQPELQHKHIALDDCIAQIKVIADHHRAITSAAKPKSEWIAYDPGDRSTWPENGSDVIVTIDKRALDEMECKDKTYYADFTVREYQDGEHKYPGFEVYYADECAEWVTHWKPMPDKAKEGE